MHKDLINFIDYTQKSLNNSIFMQMDLQLKLENIESLIIKS